MSARHGTSAGAGPVRHGQQKSHGQVANFFRLLAIVVAVAVASTAAIAGIAVWSLASSVKPGIHLAHIKSGPKINVANIGAIEGGVNMLLTGTDTRSGQGGAFSTKDELRGSSGLGNNDVTMLIHIAADHNSVTVVSFPRDLMIPVPSCPRAAGGSYPAESSAMLNSTLARGDLPCVVLTIEKLTGVEIPFAAKITLDGVIAMSDAVGGVQVCVATPINDNMVIPAIHLARGRSHPRRRGRALLPQDQARPGRRKRPRPHQQPTAVHVGAGAQGDQWRGAQQSARALLPGQRRREERDPV